MILREDQKMSCPEGQYYCNDRQKCMPIPKGKKVRKDGELVDAGNVGVAGTQYDEEKYYVREVAPPGFGHTKPDKEKGVKKGGTAAAFKRALDDGRFKGLPGDKTKKEKTASMFKLMWSMKKKGAKPHYKPGTDKKYEKYQEEEVSRRNKPSAIKKKKTLEKLLIDKEVGKIQKEDWKPEIEHVKGSDLRKKAAEKKRKKAEDSLPPHLKLDAMKKAFAHTNEQTSMKDNNLFGDAYAGSYEKLKKKIGSKKMHNKPAIEENKFVKAMVDAVKKRKEEKKPEKAMDAGARAKRLLQRKVHAKYVSGSEDLVPDDLRDHKNWNDFNKQLNEGKKKGLWDNIHAKRKRGEKPAKPGDKDYPKTLNVEHHEKDKDGNTIPHKTLNVEGLEKARKNVGADKCWDGYKAKGTKKKGGKEVPNCVKEGAAWTKKSGKSPSGGLNEKGRKSYERENPGSDLKAPSKKPGNKRRASFCARMKGMKRKLTSAKTARDPDSRINKSLRAWNC